MAKTTKKGEAHGRYFSSKANCHRCGKVDVPCSNVADEWNCADCFEAFTETVGSNCMKLFRPPGSRRDNWNGTTTQDEQVPVRKGYRATL